MAEKVIDARGLECPKPVVLTKQAIEEGALNIIVLVDNETASENVRRFAEKSGYKVKVSKEGGNFELTLVASEKKEACKVTSETVIFINHAGIGCANEELGSVLIRSFLYALSESDELPSKIVFMNEGVKLTTQGAETVESLNKLINKGVEVLVCGTCLDYFGLKDKVSAGKISNMYEILSSFMEAAKVITL